ncbi:hypothetical protein N8I77_005576 [Diaporthe amygdali]|uniref:Major facilitator superfamily (MFS) profile domain-containing protein n=1 Tax=Phomopsis amygdali TaxID=1214568 RepID=A0AAD9SEQ7_PHOAM|nr:hypothetical protein N8I77_005576 [Diaporthe amygdali]
MSEQGNFRSGVFPAAGTGAWSLNPLSEKADREPDIDVASFSLQTLPPTTSSSQSNSDSLPEEDRGSRISELGHQEQLAQSPEISQADAVEPYHVFGTRKKWAVVGLIGLAGTFSGLSSNIYFPCLNSIEKEFAVSHKFGSLTITTYQLFQGVAPLLWGTLSESLGRRQVYVYSFIVYIIANIVLSFSPSFVVLFIFRALQACGSASVVSIGNGVIQDISTSSERGGLLSVYQAIRNFSIAIGPLIGGALSQTWGFRSTFIFLAVSAGLVIITMVMFLPETLRTVAGNGSVRVKSIFYKPLWDSICRKPSDLTGPDKTVRRMPKPRDFVKPLCMLSETDTLLNLIFGAVAYSIWSIVNATTPALLGETFGLSESQLGYASLPNGIGTIMGSWLAGRLMDRDYRTVEITYKIAHGITDDREISLKSIPGDFPIEKARFRYVFWSAPLLAVFTALYGAALWKPSLTSKPGWLAVPLTLQLLIALTSNMIFAINSTLITDLHPGNGAAATAMNNFARCGLSAGAVPAAHHLIEKFGRLQTFGGMAVAFALCISLAIMSRIWGMKWRNNRLRKAENAKAENRRGWVVWRPWRSWAKKL